MGKNFGLTDLEVTGVPQSFKQVLQGVDINSVRSTGLIPTASTEPSRESLETNFEGLRVSSSQTAAGDLTFVIPENYDPVKDKLTVRFLVSSGGDTDTPTIDATLFRKRAGAALSADLNPTISAAVNNSTADSGYVEVVADGLDLDPGDAVTFVFTTSAHTTDDLNIYAVEVDYFGGHTYSVVADRA